jgi:hypothetical protein
MTEKIGNAGTRLLGGSPSSEDYASRALIDPDHPFKTLYCSHCGHQLRVRLSCGDRTCPVCRKKWYGYHFEALKKYVSTWPKIYCLTLTLKNIPDSQISRWHIQRLRKGFSRLRYRFKFGIQDGFYILQATNSGEGWHPHIHVLYRGGYLPKETISKEWCEITGGSYVVSIQLVETYQKALQYLLSDFRGKPRIREQDGETYNALFCRSRLVQGFGKYFKTKLHVPYRCPVCGDCSWTLIEVLLGEKVTFRSDYYGEPPP